MLAGRQEGLEVDVSHFHNSQGQEGRADHGECEGRELGWVWTTHECERGAGVDVPGVSPVSFDVGPL
jgi:hypothetical protein